ncbi:MAG: hypothetical protein J1G07_01725 [Clostridiales bacterium]|nr:hypothetical protein [Clostridiales bacterium]
MNKKKIVSGVVASALALSVTLSGCASLASANTVADMKQTIATVNISKADDFGNEGLDDYKDAVGTTSISKRELISYFLNVGYSYINSGYGYEATFNSLVSSLINTAVITQYSVMYLLKEKAADESKSAETIMSEYNAKETLSAKYEYVLGEDSVEIKLAKYSLLTAINSAIDSYEKNILEDEDDDNSGSDSRTTPSGIDTEQDKYYPRKKNTNGKYVDEHDTELDDKDKDKAAINYNVYTGYAGYELSESGAYQDDALEGTTPSTRKRAYNSFLSSVNSYNLIDVKNENMKDVLSLQYIQDEYVNQLEQRIISKYYEVYEKKQETDLKDGGKYEYIKQVYEDNLKTQQDTYEADGFTSTLDSMSDSSFILYSPKTDGHGVYEPASGNGKFGFVYNILLPFNAVQSNLLSEYKSQYADKDEDSGYTADYYIRRNELLRNIKTTDQRAAWFNGSKKYAFNASENAGLEYYKTDNSGSDWLFFENNLVNTDRYESLEKYAGKYPYNGKVVEKDDGYILIPNKLSIDDMLKEFSAYIDYVLGNSDNVSFKDGYQLGKENTAYYAIDDFYTADHKEDEENTKLDYGKFLYAWGAVSSVEKTAITLYDKTSNQYKAMSAVNELQYAYTTDTGVLSNYIGYSVDAAETNYIKEFEYAAQKVINEVGAGGFAVCAGDYGWHLIYVTYAFESDAMTYGNANSLDWTKIDKEEDSFEKLFYEWIKSKNIPDISTTRRNEILKQFNIDKTVTKYQNAYQDLLDLG